MGGIISQPRSGKREVTSYKMTSFRTSQQIAVLQIRREKNWKKVLHTNHNSAIS